MCVEPDSADVFCKKALAEPPRKTRRGVGRDSPRSENEDCGEPKDT